MLAASHLRLMATYNEWMNARLYTAASTLPHEQLCLERGAFFGSILRTLNHIVVGDTIWLKRFATHPAGYAQLDPVRALPYPASLKEAAFADLPSLAERRTMLDAVTIDWCAAISEPDLDHILHYANTSGVVSDKRFFSLVMHFFNHQTHHRGQVTTMLSQAGVDVGVTDLLAVIPNEPTA